mmetsp:Transcript_4852/g.6978  ORF Transcript_4852/g.6978 Transcript_4852/m.6978 type:complete len:96 (-) Transcript_4852:195-482(-)
MAPVDVNGEASRLRTSRAVVQTMRHIPRRGGDGGDDDVVFGCSIPISRVLELQSETRTLPTNLLQRQWTQRKDVDLQQWNTSSLKIWVCHTQNIM